MKTFTAPTLQPLTMLPSTSVHRVLILGGGYAGLAAATRLHRLTRGMPVQLAVVDSSPHFTERIRLHQVASGQSLPVRNMSALLPEGVQFQQGRVVRLQTAPHAEGAGLVCLETPQGATALSYDTLVYALGSTTELSTVPGVREYAHSVGDAPSAARLAHTLLPLTEKGGRVWGVGGGLTGIEAITELAERYPRLKVGLITEGPVDAGLSEKGGAYLRAALRRLNVEVMEGQRVARVESNKLVLATGTQLPCDCCVWAGGFVAPSLALEAGLPIGTQRRVRVNDQLQVEGHPEIFAVGDGAEVRIDGGDPLLMACATALPMGMHAAAQISRRLRGEPLVPFRFGYFIACISLGRHDALVQRRAPEGAPLPQIWTGRLAVWIKENICRMTLAVLALERRFGIPAYHWPEPRIKPSQPGAIRGTLDGSLEGTREGRLEGSLAKH